MSTTYSLNRNTNTLAVETASEITYHYKVHGYGFSNGELWLDQSVSAPPPLVVPKYQVIYQPAPAPQIVRVICAPPPASAPQVVFMVSGMNLATSGSSTPSVVAKNGRLSLAYQPDLCNAFCRDGSPCQNKIAKKIGNITRCQVHSTGK
jgi:hypothetical protein